MRVILGAVAVVMAVACGRSTTAPTAGLSLVSAKPTSPATGAQVSFYSQPLTLIVTNGIASTRAAPLVNRIDVAFDDAFANVVQTKEVGTDDGTQTKIMLAPLNESTTYFWRVRTTAGSVVGAYSSTSRFTIGPRVRIEAPLLLEPATETFQAKRPTLTVANAAHSGPVGSLTYRFELSTDAAFTAVTAGTVAEGPDPISFSPATDLPPGTLFYWRARASDSASGVIGAYSPARNFATIAPGDGRFPYQLSMRTPPSCPNPELGPHNYVFDGELTVSGGQLRFQQLQFAAYQHNLSVDIARAGDRITGSIGTGRRTPGNVLGTAYAINGFEVGLWGNGTTFEAARFENRLSFPAQELNAEFAANIAVWNNFGDGGGSCTAAGYRWALSPGNSVQLSGLINRH